MDESDTDCKHLFNSSDCFDFYYGPSTSVLVVKEPDIFTGKYTCQINVNASYELNSVGWIDVKLPSNDLHDDEQAIKMFTEDELGKLATRHQVPFILDEHELASFGQRVQNGGVFHTHCRSVESVSPISFLWLHLRNSTREKLKTIRFLQHDGAKILIETNKHSSRISFEEERAKTRNL